MIDGHGDDWYRYDKLVKVNFSSNIQPNRNLGGLKAYLAENMDFIMHYPEPQPRSLEKLIALKQLRTSSMSLWMMRAFQGGL